MGQVLILERVCVFFSFCLLLLFPHRPPKFGVQATCIIITCVVVVVQSLSHVRLLEPHELQPPRLLRPGNTPGKNTEVCCHFLLQGIFPIQGQNPGLLHCRPSSALQVDSLPTEPPGKPYNYLWYLLNIPIHGLLSLCSESKSGGLLSAFYAHSPNLRTAP